MEQAVVENFDDWFREATTNYWKLSHSDELRQKLHDTLRFYNSLPMPSFRVESSNIGNPLYVIYRLSRTIPHEYDLNAATYGGKDVHTTSVRDRVAAGMIFWMGMRVGEAVRIRGTHIDLISKTAMIPTEKQKKGDKKRDVIRNIPLDHVPVVELKLWNTWLEKLPDKSKVVFPYTTRTLERGIKKILKLNPHALRHALGQFTYDLTKDISLVRQILRHTPGSGATYIYTQLSIEGVRMKIGFKQVS